MDWLLFEQLDRLRRAQGALLDAVGLGPVQAPYREVFGAPGVSLRRYGSGEESGPLVLIVPAPIKQPYIWDLAPEVSAVRRCLATPARLLLACLDAARAERAVLLAHSLGGLFAAIFATLHPERVQGLALLATPLHFGADTPVFSAMAARLEADDLPESLPGAFLSMGSLNAAPGVFASERLLDAVLSAADPQRLRTHLLVERWALDEFALPRRLVAELATQIVRKDRFARGTLAIAGRSAAPSRLEASLLCVVDVGVSLQHVGPLVGRNAHARLWPKIVEWIARR